MKKIGIVTALVLAVSLISSGCAGNSEPAPQPEPEPVNGIVTEIPWPDHEFSSYAIQDSDGNEIGIVGLTIAREIGNAYILKQFYGFKHQVGSLLTLATVRADNLKPVSGILTLSDVSPAPVIEYSFDNSILTIKARDTEGNVKHHTIDIPEDAYDDNELLFLLRTIPFKIGYTTSFTNVIAAATQKHVVTITVVSEEQVQVPAGSFDAYKIELSIAGDKKYLWYSKDELHYLLKLDDGSNLFLLEEVTEEI